MTNLPLGGAARFLSLRHLDPAWSAIALILALCAFLVPLDVPTLVWRTLHSIAHTLPYIVFAVLAVAFLKATDGEGVVASAFKGSEPRMIVVAAIVGGLAPFCSCEVIPFVAALLTLGVPLSAIMALWLSSPLMDPAMFSITASALGFEFAIAKTMAAISIGALGGFAVMALRPTGYFDNPLRETLAKQSCCSARNLVAIEPVWAFWRDAPRRRVFLESVLENGHFLLKWLSLAYLLEAIMISYIPPQWVGAYLGGDGVGTIVLGAVLGGPAYLNGYAAVPLVAGLLDQGMAPGAAMSFVLAGGVSCIPAAVAVWALVRPKTFFAYLTLAFIGSIGAGFAWSAYATSM